jgi:hypothetical protein
MHAEPAFSRKQPMKKRNTGDEARPEDSEPTRLRGRLERNYKVVWQRHSCPMSLTLWQENDEPKRRRRDQDLAQGGAGPWENVKQ